VLLLFLLFVLLVSYNFSDVAVMTFLGHF